VRFDLERHPAHQHDEANLRRLDQRRLRIVRRSFHQPFFSKAARKVRRVAIISPAA
jgi:hypothetical protein